MGEEVAFWPQFSGYLNTSATDCAGYGEQPSTQTLTVQPGQTAVALLQAGGGTRNLLETSRDVAIGAGGQQWYNFELTLDANESFVRMQLSYAGTGGTDPSLNLQPGLFNVMNCAIDGQPVPMTAGERLNAFVGGSSDPRTVNASSSVGITNTILSPYWDQLDPGPEGERANLRNAPWADVNYGVNSPMCFAFIGEGANVYVPPAPAAAAPTPAPVTTPTDSNTPAPAPSSTPTSTIAEWDSRAAYKIGDLVTYQGATYRCTEAYQGYGDPSYILAPDLWVKVS